MTLIAGGMLAKQTFAQPAGSCRQALALGLDVSGSVDTLEYRLQLNGLAAALEAPRVRAALLSLPDQPVELLVYEWSGATAQHLILPWTPIRSKADIAAVQSALVSVNRRVADPGTAIGHAMYTGLRYLNARAHCGVLTLDISGDGKSNAGPDPKSVHAAFSDVGATVNALVIGADAPAIGDLRQEDIGELASYFQSHVIVGPDAFVQTALGYEAYGDAMARKLERELKGLVLSDLPVGQWDDPLDTRPLLTTQ